MIYKSYCIEGAIKWRSKRCLLHPPPDVEETKIRDYFCGVFPRSAICFCRSWRWRFLRHLTLLFPPPLRTLRMFFSAFGTRGPRHAAALAAELGRHSDNRPRAKPRSGVRAPSGNGDDEEEGRGHEAHAPSAEERVQVCPDPSRQSSRGGARLRFHGLVGSYQRRRVLGRHPPLEKMLRTPTT